MSNLPPSLGVPPASLPPQPVKQPGKKNKKVIWIILGSLLGLLVICGVISSLISSDDKAPAAETQGKTQRDTSVPQMTATPKPTKTSRPPTPTENPNQIKPGTYLVGTDIKSGLYMGTDDGCYWARLKDVSGSFDSIIANGNSDGQFYVQVKDGDFAFSTRCNMVLLDPYPTSTGVYPEAIEAGEYLVNIDIKPGLYRGLEEHCYWERLKDLYGGFDGILANGNSNGQFYVRVKDSDKALSVACGVSLVESLSGHTGDYPQRIDPGVYIVGYDIQPGLYKGDTEGCYWERLSDVTGNFGSIISNGNSTGPFYVQVSSGDFALSTNCSLERTGD